MSFSGINTAITLIGYSKTVFITAKMDTHIGIIIAYAIGLVCVIFPGKIGKAIGAWLGQGVEWRYRTTLRDDQKKVRPGLSIIAGIFILVLTYIIDSGKG